MQRSSDTIATCEANYHDRHELLSRVMDGRSCLSLDPLQKSQLHGGSGSHSQYEIKVGGSNSRVNFEKDFFLKATTSTQGGRCLPLPPSQVLYSRALVYAVGCHCPEINDISRGKTQGGGQERPRPECTNVEGTPMASVHDPRSGGVLKRKSYTECKNSQTYDIRGKISRPDTSLSFVASTNGRSCLSLPFSLTAEVSVITRFNCAYNPGK